MSKTILEQALDHLLNKEEDKASALLHDYYVGIGRKVYEDIMADDIAFEDESEQHTNEISQDSEEVDADLTEEGDEEVAPEMGQDDATADLDSELEEVPASEPGAVDVADAMLDVESALAKLKAEFEEMVSGTQDEETPAETGDEVAPEAEDTIESLEEALELSKVSNPDNSDKADEKHSPVAGKNPVGARPAVNFAGGAAEGVASGTTPAKAPSAQDLGGTTRPAVSKVAKPGTAPGREAGSSPSDLPRG